MTILLEGVIKLLLAILIGGLIGAEREFRHRAAGFRTIIFIQTFWMLRTTLRTALAPLMILALVAACAVPSSTVTPTPLTATPTPVPPTATPDNAAPQAPDVADAGTAVLADKAVSIIKGPYFGLTQDTVRIVWETDKPSDSKVEYGLTEAYGQTVKKPMPVESPYFGGVHLHEIVITGLEPDTTYHYRVSSGSASSEDSTFKTLPGTDAQSFKFAMVTDSHGWGLQGPAQRYQMNEPFTKRMVDYQPDFIIHGGDILAGTAFQYEEFARCYFTPVADLLRQFPVFMAHGDHEIGPYYSPFFGTEGSALGVNSWSWNDEWFAYSFNVGNAHIVMFDANVLEFVPPAFPEAWESEREWLIADLESDAAKNATWRFLFTHQPYTEEAIRVFLAPLVEEYEVDVFGAGHHHLYDRFVSLDPEIGARTVFLTMGSATQAQGDIGYRSHRIAEGYANSTDSGVADYLTAEVNGDELVIRVHTLIPTGGKGPDGVLDEFTLSKAEPQLEFTDLELSPNQVVAGEAVTIKVTVTNVGRGFAAVSLRTADNGEPVVKYVVGTETGEKRIIGLQPGESEEIEVTLPLYNPGKHEIEVAGSAPQIVEVSPREPKLVFSDMDIPVGLGSEADTVRVTAAVQNVGSSAGTTEAQLYVDGEAVSSQILTLQPQERTTVSFLHKFTESGTHVVGVGDLVAEAVVLQGTLGLIPIVPDLSGRGNNGMVRGNPGWIDGVIGKAMGFDGIDDYVKVPDSESLHLTDEFTAIVWANIDNPSRDATLLGKGISIGYGPNFLIRMILRPNGEVTWGTTYGPYEFFSDGGTSKLGEWAQYLLAYDGSTGTSNGYVDLEQVTENIGGQTPLNYWAGYPVLTGMSPNGPVDSALVRGSRMGVLDGAVDEIRIYNVRLSPDEMQQIYAHPDELGPRSENLVLWLSFDEMETSGTHSTEWRQPIALVPSYVGEKQLWSWEALEAEASIPDGARIEAVIQVSDDGRTIKDATTIALEDGTQSYDISGLKSAQYIQIVSKFDASVTGKTIAIPKLDKYAVTAGARGITAKIVWSTQVGWEKGEMTPTVGVYESLSRHLFEIYQTLYGGSESLPQDSEWVALLKSWIQVITHVEPKPVPPLPEMAQSVSGKTYVLEDNIFDWRSFALDFQEQGAFVSLTFGNDSQEMAIGLDDVYRITHIDQHGPMNGPVAFKGSWEDDDTFVLHLQYLTDGGPIQFDFDEDGVIMRLLMGDGTESIRGTLQD
jgi:predicted phosphodiesterase